MRELLSTFRSRSRAQQHPQRRTATNVGALGERLFISVLPVITGSSVHGAERRVPLGNLRRELRSWGDMGTRVWKRAVSVSTNLPVVMTDAVETCLIRISMNR